MLDFVAATKFCGRYWFEFDNCAMPLAATVSLVILVVVFAIGLALWRLMRICRQPDNQTTRQPDNILLPNSRQEQILLKKRMLRAQVTMERLRWNGDKSVLYSRT